jgi:cell shape-determining protein MreC
MNYRRNISKKMIRGLVLGGAIFALLLILFIWSAMPPRFLTKWAFSTLKPFLFFKSYLTNFAKDNLAVFKSKKELLKENQFLKNKLEEMSVSSQVSAHVLKQNKELRKIIFENRDKKLVAASIISRPGYGLYNSLIIDAGLDQGLKPGMIVTAFGMVYLGYLSDVFSDTSRVKLASFPEEETNVYIEGVVSAIARGLGGENLEISLPYGVKVAIGDQITTLHSNPLFFGVVQKIIKEPTNPFQKIIFRIPINIQELRYVYLPSQ